MSDIQHAHLYGMREAKYDWLSTHDVNSTDWTKLEPQKPFSLFIPQDNEFSSEYQKGWKITDVFPINSMGVKTNRDHLLINFEKEELIRKISQLESKSMSDDEVRQSLGLEDSPYWNTTRERQKIRVADWQSNIVQCLYRVFDKRWLLYQQNLIEIGRGGAGTKVMGNIIRGNNLALIINRQIKMESIQHTFVGDCPVDFHALETANASVYALPLYIYPDPNNPQKSTVKEQSRPNFSDEFLTEITNKLGYTPTPEAIFYYIYAIFHSPTYRTRYAEFLKIDFPRVPLTSDDQLFRKLGEYGEELVALHLMKSPKLDQHLTQIIDKGGEFVVDAGHPKFLPSPTGRGAGGEGGEVIINKKGDRFTGVPKSVWEFYVGGYQVCHKWLKDRKGRQLSPKDLNHYQKIIVALSETMQIMKAIDAAIPSFPIK
jgi:predicted helicase